MPELSSQTGFIIPGLKRERRGEDGNRTCHQWKNISITSKWFVMGGKGKKLVKVPSAPVSVPKLRDAAHSSCPSTIT